MWSSRGEWDGASYPRHGNRGRGPRPSHWGTLSARLCTTLLTAAWLAPYWTLCLQSMSDALPLPPPPPPPSAGFVITIKYRRYKLVVRHRVVIKHLFSFSHACLQLQEVNTETEPIKLQKNKVSSRQNTNQDVFNPIALIFKLILKINSNKTLLKKNNFYNFISQLLFFCHSEPKRILNITRINP